METTWDGRPVAQDDPRGCAIVVYRDNDGRREFLLLHRRHAGPPGFAGDWAWTPPSGARLPGEAVAAAAARELFEETGLTLRCRATNTGEPGWAIYAAEASSGDGVALDEEHDEYAWLPLDAAAARCLPSHVGAAIRAVDALLRDDPVSVSDQERFASAAETPSPTNTEPEA